MAQINDIYLGRMNNGAHFDYVSNTAKMAAQDAAVMEHCSKQQEALQKAADDEDEVLVLSKKSPLTDPIYEADKERDTQFVLFSTHVRNMRNFPDENVAAAANRLDQLLKDYGIKTTDQYDKETGLMTNLCQDLLGKDLADVQAVMMVPVVEAMKTANDRVRQLLNERSEQEAGRETGRVKAARKASDEAYHDFVRAVNSYAYVLGTGVFDKFIGFMNAEILRVKSQVLKQKTSAPAASPSDPEAGLPGAGEGEGETGGGSGSTGGGSGTGTGTGGTGTGQKYTVAWYYPNGNPIVWYELYPGDPIPAAPDCPEGYYWHPYPTTMPAHDLDIIPEPIKG